MSEYFIDREKKINLLLSYQKDQAVSFIINYISDEDPFVRAEALLVLNNINNKSLYMHITPSLKDDDHHVRYSAADALGKLKSLDSSKDLIEAFDDNSEFVQCKIIDSLGKIHSEYSSDFLMSKLYDKNQIIRDEVHLALENMIDYDICEKRLVKFFEEDNTREEVFDQLYKMLHISQKYKNTFNC
ncbi:MAG: HEAT repeat domain-containing protein [Vampirovibrionia bacterium]